MPDITDPQPPPRAGREPVTRLVMADLAERERQGVEKYGRPLETHNGRNPAWDAYQESLDQTQYLRQLAMEWDDAKAEIERLRARLAATNRAACEMRMALEWIAHNDSLPDRASPIFAEYAHYRLAGLKTRAERGLAAAGDVGRTSGVPPLAEED